MGAIYAGIHLNRKNTTDSLKRERIRRLTRELKIWKLKISGKTTSGTNSKSSGHVRESTLYPWYSVWWYYYLSNQVEWSNASVLDVGEPQAWQQYFNSGCTWALHNFGICYVKSTYALGIEIPASFPWAQPGLELD